LKCWFVLTKVHTPPFCRNLNLTGYHPWWGAAAPVQSCDAHLHIICKDLCCPFQKNVVIHHFCFLTPWYSGESYLLNLMLLRFVYDFPRLQDCI
jgi:hypothetical protein